METAGLLELVKPHPGAGKSALLVLLVRWLPVSTLGRGSAELLSAFEHVCCKQAVSQKAVSLLDAALSCVDLVPGALYTK